MEADQIMEKVLKVLKVLSKTSRRHDAMKGTASDSVGLRALNPKILDLGGE